MMMRTSNSFTVLAVAYAGLVDVATISTVTDVTCVCPIICRELTSVWRGSPGPIVQCVRKTSIPLGYHHRGMDVF